MVRPGAREGSKNTNCHCNTLDRPKQREPSTAFNRTFRTDNSES